MKLTTSEKTQARNWIHELHVTGMTKADISRLMGFKSTHGAMNFVDIGALSPAKFTALRVHMENRVVQTAQVNLGFDPEIAIDHLLDRIDDRIDALDERANEFQMNLMNITERLTRTREMLAELEGDLN